LAIVPLINEAGRAVKANLSLDAGLLAAIDDAAAARGIRGLLFSQVPREKRSSLRDSYSAVADA